MLARCGLRERALAQYETCRGLLAEELGIEPEPATLALFRKIKDGPLQSPAPPPEPFLYDEPQPLRLLSETAERPSLFVAREEELDILHRRLEEAISAGPRFVAGASDLVNLARIAPAQSSRVQLLADNNLSTPRLLTWFLAFNVNVPPLDDLRVRRALAMAIDRQQLADVALPGTVLPADGGVIPPRMTGHVPDIGLSYEPREARRLLADAGFPGGKGLPAIRFGAFRPVIGNQVCNQWQEQLGVTVEPDYFKSTAASGPAFRAGRIGILRIGWVCDCPDPDYVLRVGMYNYVSGDEKYVALIEKARSLSDQNRRLRLYRRAEQLLIDEALIFPLLYGRTNLLVQPWVKRLPVSALKWWFLQDVVIERTSHSA